MARRCGLSHDVYAVGTVDGFVVVAPVEGPVPDATASQPRCT